MSDLRDILHRKQEEAHPAPGAFERLQSRRRRREFRRRVTAWTWALVVLVLGAVTTIRLFSVGRSTEPVTPAGPPRVARNVVLERSPAVIATGLGFLWVAEEPRVSLEGAEFQADERLLRLDPETGLPTEAFPVSAAASGSAMEVGEGAVWLGGLGTVTSIDPNTGKQVEAYGFGGTTTALALARGEPSDSPLRGIWVATPVDDALHHITPASGEVRTFEVGDRPLGVAVGEGAVWVVLGGDGAVGKVDAAAAEVVERIEVPGAAGPIVVQRGAVWAATGTGVARIDPIQNRVVAHVRLGSSPQTLAVGVGGVWVATDEGIAVIDPSSNVASRVLDVADVRGLAPAAGGMWAATEQELLLLQRGTLASD